MDLQTGMNKFDVNIKLNKISDYETLFDKNKFNYKKHLRDNKLSILLDNNSKYQFTLIVYQETPFYLQVGNSFDIMFKHVFGELKSITFNYEGDLIKKITVDVRLLQTEWGKNIKDLIESGLDIKLEQDYIGGNIRFYIKS